MLLFIDNYDSFTYNLVSYCQELGAETKVITNDQMILEEVVELNPAKILISPGPGSPDDSGICMAVIDHFHRDIPILGVCLGHQCIAKYFGAKVVVAHKPMHGKTSVIRHDKSTLFNRIPNNFLATRYHSLIVDNDYFDDANPYRSLEVTAYTDQNKIYEIMALQHVNYQVYGVQFHPEAVQTEHGHQLLNNFLKI